MTSVVAEKVQERREKLLEEFKVQLRQLGVVPFFTARDVALLGGNFVVLKSGLVVSVVGGRVDFYVAVEGGGCE